MTKKLEGTDAPSHANYFPKITGSKFWDSDFIQRSKKTNNYVFGDDLLLHSPRGRGYKLQTLTIAYI